MKQQNAQSDKELILPQHKADLENLRPWIHSGYPAVEPVLPELLRWLQDGNWPINAELLPFLQTIGLPLVPHIQVILQTNDGMWKYFVMLWLVKSSPEIAQAVRYDLTRILESPTREEEIEELPELAKEILEKYQL